MQNKPCILCKAEISYKNNVEKILNLTDAQKETYALKAL
jgi:hypothetical protein